MRNKIEEHKITFSILFDLTDQEIIADNKQIEQVLINLVLNSVGAVRTTPIPSITMQAISLNDSVIIKINDNGSGIPADILDKIFIPFYTTKEEGSGIGLSLSRQMLLLHGSSITISSVEGKGSEFILSF